MSHHEAKTFVVHAAVPVVFSDYRPIFRNVVTINPSRTLEAWDRLSINTRAIEYRELPMKLHRGLMNALRLERT